MIALEENVINSDYIALVVNPENGEAVEVKEDVLEAPQEYDDETTEEDYYYIGFSEFMDEIKEEFKNMANGFMGLFFSNQQNSSSRPTTPELEGAPEPSAIELAPGIPESNSFVVLPHPGEEDETPTIHNKLRSL